MIIGIYVVLTYLADHFDPHRPTGLVTIFHRSFLHHVASYIAALSLIKMYDV